MFSFKKRCFFPIYYLAPDSMIQRSLRKVQEGLSQRKGAFYFQRVLIVHSEVHLVNVQPTVVCLWPYFSVWLDQKFVPHLLVFLLLLQIQEKMTPVQLQEPQLNEFFYFKLNTWNQLTEIKDHISSQSSRRWLVSRLSPLVLTLWLKQFWKKAHLKIAVF